MPRENAIVIRRFVENTIQLTGGQMELEKGQFGFARADKTLVCRDTDGSYHYIKTDQAMLDLMLVKAPVQTAGSLPMTDEKGTLRMVLDANSYYFKTSSGWTRFSDLADISLAAETGTGTDTSTPEIPPASLQSILQTIWAKIRQVANMKATVVIGAAPQAAPMFTELDDCELRCGSDTSIAGWKQVTFEEPMTDVPSVSIQVEGDYNALPKVRNVDAQGFEYMVGIVGTSISYNNAGISSGTATLPITATANVPISYVATLDVGG